MNKLNPALKVGIILLGMALLLLFGGAYLLNQSGASFHGLRLFQLSSLDPLGLSFHMSPPLHLEKGSVEIGRATEIGISTDAVDLRIESAKGTLLEYEPVAGEVRGRVISSLAGDSAEIVIHSEGASSGELRLRLPATVQKVTVRTANGSILLHSLKVKELAMTSANGEVAIHDCLVQTSADISSINGDVELDLAVPSIQVRVVSADAQISLHEKKPIVQLSSVSGDVDLRFPKGSGFSAQLNTISGSLSLLEPMSAKKEKKRKSANPNALVVGNGDGQISARSVSGNIRIGEIQ